VLLVGDLSCIGRPAARAVGLALGARSRAVARSARAMIVASRVDVDLPESSRLSEWID